MNRFPAAKAKRVLKALERIGWVVIRQEGSHKILAKEGYMNFTFAFHDSVELSPLELKFISKSTGLLPDDL